MKRLLQSGAVVVLLVALLILTLINTAQLHNIESKLAAGVPTTNARPVTPVATVDSVPLPTEIGRAHV